MPLVCDGGVTKERRRKCRFVCKVTSRRVAERGLTQAQQLQCLDATLESHNLCTRHRCLESGVEEGTGKESQPNEFRPFGVKCPAANRGNASHVQIAGARCVCFSWSSGIGLRREMQPGLETWHMGIDTSTVSSIGLSEQLTTPPITCASCF